jgi:magnesium chelatase family protein
MGVGRAPRAMSLAETHSFAFAGIEATPVRISASVSPGPSAFTIAGLPDASGWPACLRVRAAFAGIGLSLPPGRVHVGFIGAGASAEADHHDLPVALCALAAMGVLPREELSWYAALAASHRTAGSWRCRACCRRPLVRRRRNWA